jgi:uncharacterized protein (DUF2267 family)
MRDINSRTLTFDHRRYRDQALNRSARRKAINFDAYAAEGNRIVNELAFQLDIERNSAARILRSVLHAMRDRLPPVDAIQFAQGLPMALKGIFLDQYDISRAPVQIRSAHKFLDYVYEKNIQAAQVDFPDPESLVEAGQGVMTVLERNMNYGQIEQVKRLMGDEIRYLLETQNVY